MKAHKPLFFIGILLLVLTSCSVEKRLYTSGYHIDWRKKDHHPDQQQSIAKSDNKAIDLSAAAVMNTDSLLVNETVAIVLPEDSLSAKKEKALISQDSSLPEVKNIASVEKAQRNKLKELKADEAKNPTIIGSVLKIILVLCLIVLGGIIVLGIILVVNPSLLNKD